MRLQDLERFRESFKGENLREYLRLVLAHFKTLHHLEQKRVVRTLIPEAIVHINERETTLELHLNLNPKVVPFQSGRGRLSSTIIQSNLNPKLNLNSPFEHPSSHDKPRSSLDVANNNYLSEGPKKPVFAGLPLWAAHSRISIQPFGGLEKKSGLLLKLVEQPEYGTNTSYLVDFIKIMFSAKHLNLEEIRDFYLNRGLSAAQIARHFEVAKSVILSRLHDLGIQEGRSAHRSTNPENYRLHVAPYGYAVRDGRLIPNKAEMKLCRLVVELVARRGFSANAAAKELGKRGYKNRSGHTKWDHSTIQSIFNRWKEKL